VGAGGDKPGPQQGSTAESDRQDLVSTFRAAASKVELQGLLRRTDELHLRLPKPSLAPITRPRQIPSLALFCQNEVSAGGRNITDHWLCSAKQDPVGPRHDGRCVRWLCSAKISPTAARNQFLDRVIFGRPASAVRHAREPSRQGGAARASNWRIANLRRGRARRS
jgi:hypothetical protein